jgi:hypothetical protein
MLTESVGDHAMPHRTAPDCAPVGLNRRISCIHRTMTRAVYIP